MINIVKHFTFNIVRSQPALYFLFQLGITNIISIYPCKYDMDAVLKNRDGHAFPDQLEKCQ